MEVSQYSWKPSFYFVPRCANYKFIDFKFTLPYLLCDNELGSLSISPFEQTVLSFVSHQLRELKEYFRRGFSFWFQMSCCILLLLFPVAWSIHGACMGWHLVALCPSFASRMHCLLVTSHPWPGPGGHLTAVLCFLYSRLHPTAAPQLPPTDLGLPVFWRVTFFIPGNWGPALAAATRKLCHSVDHNHTISHQVCPPAIRRGASSRGVLPWVCPLSSRLPFRIFYIFIIS